MRNRLTVLLLLCVVGLLVISPLPMAAQERAPVIAIDRSIGTGGTSVGFTGVGFTPGGRVTVLLTLGLGLVVAETTANRFGGVSGSFVMPANVPEVGTSGRVQVFAIDNATGRETLPAFFMLTLTPPLDYPLPNGRFFTQTNGFPLGTNPTGFAVVNTTPFVVPVRFFDEFLRLGGVAEVGFPASQPFVLDGFVTQVFQKAVFQWRPEVNRAFFVNVFDVLHDRGFDDFLLAVRSTPRQLDSATFDAGKSPDQIVRDRLALLDANPAIRARYFAADDPLLRFGLPTSPVVDFGNHFAIRLQRAVIQQWRVAVPWAAPGQVVVANGGDIGKEVGLFPSFAVSPQPQPTFSSRIVAFDPGKGERVQSGFLVRGDAAVFEATVVFQLIGESGEIIREGSTLARVAGPDFGRFSTTVDFAVARDQPAVLRLFERSAADGSIVVDTLVNIPLVLVR